MSCSCVWSEQEESVEKEDEKGKDEKARIVDTGCNWTRATLTRHFLSRCSPFRSIILFPFPSFLIEIIPQMLYPSLSPPYNTHKIQHSVTGHQHLKSGTRVGERVEGERL